MGADPMKPIKIVISLFLFLLHHTFAHTLSINSDFQESMTYRIKWMGMVVGRIHLSSEVNAEQGLLQANAKVDSFSYLQKIYYIGGFFGTHWNYKTRQSHYAYEEIYQGPQYFKRTFQFYRGNVFVENRKIAFDESSWPHNSSKQTIKYKKQYTLPAPGYLDLLGSFYYIRTAGKTPVPGSVEILHVLPAGKKESLILQVLGQEETSSAAFGNTECIKVKTALQNPKHAGGGDLFFKTKSHILMWISYDENYIPVKIQTSVDYLGTVYIELEKYSRE